jgi:hypothetical protein
VRFDFCQMEKSLQRHEEREDFSTSALFVEAEVMLIEDTVTN